jgi:cytochrome c biogenesis protein CcmG/thiol:disulfide interchange protein DsbE
VKKRKFPILAVVLVLTSYCLRQDFAKPADVATDSARATRQPAPEFTLPDLGGHKVDLVRYRGHVVLLNFWATWCAPCRAEMPELMKLQRNYRDQGLRIIGISLDDDPKPVLDIFRQLKMNYPVVIGDAGLAERYGGILGLPVSFLIGCDGRICARYNGKIDILHVEQELKLLLKTQPCAGKNPGM